MARLPPVPRATAPWPLKLRLPWMVALATLMAPLPLTLALPLLVVTSPRLMAPDVLLVMFKSLPTTMLPVLMALAALTVKPLLMLALAIVRALASVMMA